MMTIFAIYLAAALVIVYLALCYYVRPRHATRAR